jgi:serine protease Do
MIKRLTAVLIVSTLLLMVTSCTSPVTSEATKSTITVTTTITNAAVTTTIASQNANPYSFADVVVNTMHSVCFIQQTYKNAKGETVEVSGTGIILRSDGYILTNRHVLENAQTIQVTLENLKTYTPTKVYLDDTMDLAVLKINETNLPTITFANPNLTHTGDWVIAIGHVLGVSPADGGAAATTGIISTLGRSFFIGGTPYYDVIQTDAAINSGNSGGPLINLNGELVGINSASSSEGQGIGFAINVATARHIFEDLVTYGKPEHPYLGLSLQDITTTAGRSMVMGSQVTYVESSSPADKAGIKVDDIITSFDGQRVNFTSDLIRQLWRSNVGAQVPVIVIRGTTTQIQITLGNRPENGLSQTQPLNSPSARF